MSELEALAEKIDVPIDRIRNDEWVAKAKEAQRAKTKTAKGKTSVKTARA